MKLYIQNYDIKQYDKSPVYYCYKKSEELLWKKQWLSILYYDYIYELNRFNGGGKYRIVDIYLEENKLHNIHWFYVNNNLIIKDVILNFPNDFNQKKYIIEGDKFEKADTTVTMKEFALEIIRIFHTCKSLHQENYLKELNNWRLKHYSHEKEFYSLDDAQSYITFLKQYKSILKKYCKRQFIISAKFLGVPLVIISIGWLLGIISVSLPILLASPVVLLVLRIIELYIVKESKLKKYNNLKDELFNNVFEQYPSLANTLEVKKDISKSKTPAQLANSKTSTPDSFLKNLFNEIKNMQEHNNIDWQKESEQIDSLAKKYVQIKKISGKESVEILNEYPEFIAILANIEWQMATKIKNQKNQDEEDLISLQNQITTLNNDYQLNLKLFRKKE